MNGFRLPWRTCLAIYGGFLLVSNLSGIALRAFLVPDAHLDQTAAAILRGRFVMSAGLCAFGAALLVLGLVLAIRKSRSRRASEAGNAPPRKVET